jgi:hypothetical protein
MPNANGHPTNIEQKEINQYFGQFHYRLTTKNYDIAS